MVAKASKSSINTRKGSTLLWSSVPFIGIHAGKPLWMFVWQLYFKGIHTSITVKGASWPKEIEAMPLGYEMILFFIFMFLGILNFIHHFLHLVICMRKNCVCVCMLHLSVLRVWWLFHSFALLLTALRLYLEWLNKCSGIMNTYCPSWAYVVQGAARKYIS